MHFGRIVSKVFSLFLADIEELFTVHATHLHGLYSTNPDTTGACFSCLPLSLACTRYSSSTKSLSNRFAHLTNYSVNKKNKEFTPNTDETVCQGHKWCVFTYVLYAFLFPTLLYTSLMQNTYIHSVCIRHIRMYTFITCLYMTANVLYAHLYSCVYACATAYVRIYVHDSLLVHVPSRPLPSPTPSPPHRGLLAFWEYMRTELHLDTDPIWESIQDLVIKTIIRCVRSTPVLCVCVCVRCLRT